MMIVLNDSEKAILLLASRVADRSAAAYAPGEWANLQRRMADFSVTPADLWDEEVVAGLGLDEGSRARIGELLGRAPGLVFELDRLASLGIWAITDLSDEYPDSLRIGLRTQAPPVLVGAGSRPLVATRGLAIFGSRNVDPAGARIAGDAARCAARIGLPVISGGARGVDQIAMAAAFEVGGRVIGVLADSLEQKVKQADVRSALLEDRLCLVTPQHPAAGFSVGAAMGRNKIIYALARSALVIASDLETGGTWAGAVEALKKGLSQVLVWSGEGGGPGNQALIDLGSTPVPTIEALGVLLSSAPASVASSDLEISIEQLDLFT